MSEIRAHYPTIARCSTICGKPESLLRKVILYSSPNTYRDMWSLGISMLHKSGYRMLKTTVFNTELELLFSNDGTGKIHLGIDSGMYRQLDGRQVIGNYFFPIRQIPVILFYANSVSSIHWVENIQRFIKSMKTNHNLFRARFYMYVCYTMY